MKLSSSGTNKNEEYIQIVCFKNNVNIENKLWVGKDVIV